MILTVTLNPSMDYLYTIPHFKIGLQNRFEPPIKMVGGKGINAGRTATILGADVIATGVLAGDNGGDIAKRLIAEKFESHFFKIEGETRNAITIMHDQEIQTEIVEVGPRITEAIAKKIMTQTLELCQKNPDINVVCLSGSANSENEYLYTDIAKLLKSEVKQEIKILADISGQQLKNILTSKDKPYFIKPNIHEFSDLIDSPISTKSEALVHLNNDLISSIPLVIISCGAEGALAKSGNTFYDLTIPKIKLVNPTGSGDATVGGVSYALDSKLGVEETLKYAMASGVANAMEKAVGFVNLENVEKIMPAVKIKEISI